MQVLVRLRLPVPRTVELAPEAVIGRIRLAAPRLDAPAVSEAHAMHSAQVIERK